MDDNVQVRSKTDLSIHTTKGWGGVGMITYRSGARQTGAYIRPKGGVGWGGDANVQVRMLTY